MRVGWGMCIGNRRRPRRGGAAGGGLRVSSRYLHEQPPGGGRISADAPAALPGHVPAPPGMVHANVNYAAGVAFVAYDTTQVTRSAIEQVLRASGAQPQTRAEMQPHIAAQPAAPAQAPEAHAGHDHGSAPSFLPHWAQERWTILLVAAAGLCLLIGWVGETFLGLAPEVALLFYLLAYLAGGFYTAPHHHSVSSSTHLTPSSRAPE